MLWPASWHENSKIDKYEINGCSNVNCDKEMKVTEVEKRDFKESNFHHEAPVEIEKIYISSLSKKIKNKQGSHKIFKSFQAVEPK